MGHKQLLHIGNMSMHNVMGNMSWGACDWRLAVFLVLLIMKRFNEACVYNDGGCTHGTDSSFFAVNM